MKKVFIALSVIAASSCNHSMPSVKTGFEGKPMPEFRLLMNDSVTYLNTASIPTGKPVVLLYFSPNCPYCRAEINGILKNIESLKDIRFYFFATWPVKEIKAFSTYYHLDKYPNIEIGQDCKGFFLNHFKVTRVPYTAIFKKDKRLNEVFMGKVEPEQIKEVAEN